MDGRTTLLVNGKRLVGELRDELDQAANAA